MTEPANDNGKKPRKQRAKGPKAPNKKAQPREWAQYQLCRAMLIVERLKTITGEWIDTQPLASVLSHMDEAFSSYGKLTPVFVAPRKRRAKKDLTVSEDSGTV